MDVVLAFDVGATKIAGALIGPSGEILEKTRLNWSEVPYATGAPGRWFIHGLERVIWALSPHPSFNGIKAIGLASAGPMNVQKQLLVRPVNFPHLAVVAPVVRLKSRLQKLWPFLSQVPVAFQNDAMAAAFAEAWLGHAKGLETFALVTLGTGLGVAVVIHQQPCQTLGYGSEWGHNLWQVLPTGEIITFEDMASGRGLLSQAQRLFNQQYESVSQLVGQNPSAASILFEHFSQALAGILYNISLGIKPQKILISGGLLAFKDWFWDRMHYWYEKFIHKTHSKFKTPIQISAFNDQAPLLGAAYLAWQQVIPVKSLINPFSKN